MEMPFLPTPFAYDVMRCTVLRFSLLVLHYTTVWQRAYEQNQADGHKFSAAGTLPLGLPAERAEVHEPFAGAPEAVAAPAIGACGQARRLVVGIGEEVGIEGGRTVVGGRARLIAQAVVVQTAAGQAVRGADRGRTLAFGREEAENFGLSDAGPEPSILALPLRLAFAGAPEFVPHWAVGIC